MFRRYIYKLTFPNGYVYIGSTGDCKQRWADNGKHYAHNAEMYDAIQRYGWDSVRKEVIVSLPEGGSSYDRAAFDIERELVKAYSLAGLCYNKIGSKEYAEQKMEAARERGDYVPEKMEAFGESLSLKQWCKRYNIGRTTVLKRMSRHGLTLEEALTFPRVPLTTKGKGLAIAEDYWRSVGVLTRELRGVGNG